MSPTSPVPTTSATLVRACGALIATLALSSAVLMALPWPDGADRSIPGEIGGIALIGAMLTTLFIVWRTRGTGSSPGWLAVIVLGAAAAIVAGITKPLSPRSDVVDVSETAFLLTGVLSYIVSIGILSAGRWQGAARYLPIAANSWPIVAAVALLMRWPDGLGWVGPMAVIVFLHAALGIVLAVRPSLTAPKVDTAGAR